MKRIAYTLLRGTAEPMSKELVCEDDKLESHLAIAAREAENGEYSVEEVTEWPS